MNTPTTPDKPPPADTLRTLAPLLALCLVLFLLYSVNHDFPLGYHADEYKKVSFILTGEQDFFHLLLMLDIVRAINAVAAIRDPQELVELGRLTTATAALLIVLAAYGYARPWLGRAAALAAEALCGLTPIVAVHAHYLKEDILLTAGCMLTLVALQHYAGQPSLRRSVVVGLALGIALSAKYTALLLLPAAAVLPWFHGAIDRRRYFAGLTAGCALAGIVFLGLNYPILGNWQGFLAGISYEGEHWMTGHATAMPLSEHWFGFHLLHSLEPGLTWPLLILVLFAVAYSLARWRTIPWQQRFATFCALGGYAFFEASPLKPFPGFMRYMLPLVPLLACLVVASVHEISGRLQGAGWRAAPWLLAGLVGGVAALDSGRLVYPSTVIPALWLPTGLPAVATARIWNGMQRTAVSPRRVAWAS